MMLNILIVCEYYNCITSSDSVIQRVIFEYVAILTDIN